jgi:PKD repeat protein
MEIAEEEALMHRIMQDQMLRESKTVQMTQDDSVQTGQTSADTIASPAAGAGAGGVPPYDFFAEGVEVADFSYIPTPAVAGSITYFTNLTRTPENDTFLWQLGSGSLTSTDINPTITYNQTGSYTAILQATSSRGIKSSKSIIVSVIVPSLSATFTGDTFNLTATSFTASLTSSITYNSSGNITGWWRFGDGASASYASPITHSYGTLEVYTATLQVTESIYNITASVSASVDPFLDKIIMIL